MADKRRLAGISCLVMVLSGGWAWQARADGAASQPQQGQAVLTNKADLAKETVAEILEPQSAQAQTQLKETPAQRAARLAWWQEARLGLFVHWGPVSLTGKEIGWSRGGERRDGYGSGPIPAEIYDNLYKQFSPTNFNAKEWVQTVKDAGMKYIIFVTKHHDGFCMWGTKTTDYNITSPLSPYGRDIAGELATACHAADVKLIWYLSLGDWRHPDYYTENHARFDEFVLEQIRELCTNYGKIYGFWFDLAYTRMAEKNMGQKISKLIHRLQPGAVINNRGGLSGDYDTPEGRVGAFQIERPWESCITLGNQWAWRPNDDIKSLEECIYILVNTAGGDGNLAIDVGPMPDGRIEPKQVARLMEIGGWMKEYGESIYGTRGGPFLPGDYGSSTHKGNRVYLHVLNWDDQTLSLPPIGKQIINSTLLSGGRVNVTQTKDGITVAVNKQDQQNPDTIVVLELDGPAHEVSPIITASASLAFGKHITGSSSERTFDPGKAFDGDYKTGWAAKPGETQGWLEADLGHIRTVAQAVIYETYPGRIQDFELQYKAGVQWETLYRGTGLGAQAVIRFKPVPAQHIRLNVLKASGSPAITELKLTGPLTPVKKEYKMQGEPASEEAWAQYMSHWLKVGASSVHQNMRQYGPDKLFEGGRWIADQNETIWLDVDYGRSRTVNQAEIGANRYWQNVQNFELLKLVDGQWQSFYSSKELGLATGTVKLTFAPITISQLRMKITMKGSTYLETYALKLFDINESLNPP